jgi:hypothetical protein
VLFAVVGCVLQRDAILGALLLAASVMVGVRGLKVLRTRLAVAAPPARPLPVPAVALAQADSGDGVETRRHAA